MAKARNKQKTGKLSLLKDTLAAEAQHTNCLGVVYTESIGVACIKEFLYVTISSKNHVCKAPSIMYLVVLSNLSRNVFCSINNTVCNGNSFKLITNLSFSLSRLNSSKGELAIVFVISAS